MSLILCGNGRHSKRAAGCSLLVFHLSILLVNREKRSKCVFLPWDWYFELIYGLEFFLLYAPLKLVQAYHKIASSARLFRSRLAPLSFFAILRSRVLLRTVVVSSPLTELSTSRVNVRKNSASLNKFEIKCRMVMRGVLQRSGRNSIIPNEISLKTPNRLK